MRENENRFRSWEELRREHSGLVSTFSKPRKEGGFGGEKDFLRYLWEKERPLWEDPQVGVVQQPCKPAKQRRHLMAVRAHAKGLLDACEGIAASGGDNENLLAQGTRDSLKGIERTASLAIRDLYYNALIDDRGNIRHWMWMSALVPYLRWRGMKRLPATWLADWLRAVEGANPSLDAVRVGWAKRCAALNKSHREFLGTVRGQGRAPLHRLIQMERFLNVFQGAFAFLEWRRDAAAQRGGVRVPDGFRRIAVEPDEVSYLREGLLGCFGNIFVCKRLGEREIVEASKAGMRITKPQRALLRRAYSVQLRLSPRKGR